VEAEPDGYRSYQRWYDYVEARDLMFKATNSKHDTWHVIRSDDKRRARLNCIAHIWTRSRSNGCALKPSNCKALRKGRYNDQPSLPRMNFVAERY